MSTIEYDYRGQLSILVDQAQAHLNAAKAIYDTNYLNPQDLTRDQLTALKEELLASYLTSGKTMAVVKLINANSKAQSSSAKLSLVNLNG